MNNTKEKSATVSKIEASANGKTANTVETAKPMQVVLEEQKKVSAQDRIKKAEQFEILANRHEALVEKKSQLAKFLISDDGTQGVNLVFKSRNQTFEISNNAVIKEVLTYAKTKLDSLIETSEAEVLHFVI